MPTETETETENPPNPPGGDAYGGFDAFWSAYPAGKRKVGRPKCREKWKRDRLASEAEAVMRGLARWKKSKHWADGFVPQPHRFLNDRFWEADPGEAAPAADDNGFVRRTLTPEDLDYAEGVNGEDAA